MMIPPERIKDIEARLAKLEKNVGGIVKCGDYDKPPAECKHPLRRKTDNPTITIDRKVAEEWMQYDSYDQLDDIEKRLYNELRRSLGEKEGA